MAAYITFFPVDNGDTTLIETTKSKYIMIDCDIRDAENDENIYDCYGYLKGKLPRSSGQLYIDAFILTHSDNDHCRGSKEYFNLCCPEEADEDKIRIDELCVPAKLLIDEEHYNDDADAIRKEARRRLDLLGEDGADIPGNRIKIIGYSDSLKEYSDVIVPAGGTIPDINGEANYGAEIFVLRPVKRTTDDEESDVNDCTASFKISFEINSNTYEVIIGGDLKCENWKEVIDLNPEMTFDLLLAPHHCSWHAISTEDKKTGNPDSTIAEFLKRSSGAYIVASCKEIKRNDDNPPSYRAKNFYIKNLDDKEHFKCTAEYPEPGDAKPMVFKITGQGLSLEPVPTQHRQNNSFVQKSYGNR